MSRKRTAAMSQCSRTGQVTSCAAWSPDGEKIAYCSGRDGEVYVMDADGSDVRQVSHVTKSDSAFVTPFPVWSPDGTELAFTMLGPDEESELIVVADADGNNQRTLSPLPEEFEYTTDKNPVWSPDGKQIVFVNAGGRPRP